MLLHIPWSRNLGGARVQLELAEEFVLLGCQVEKFDWNDAFPLQRQLGRISRKAGLLASTLSTSFAAKARAYVRKNGHRFDIIDCHQSNLPFSKDELGFSGLLVCRSVGLYAFYEQFAMEERKLFPSVEKPRGLVRRISNHLREARAQSLAGDSPKSLAVADLINLPNEDEREYVSDVLGLGEKCIVQPFGLSTARLAAFRDQHLASELRLAAQEVVFIGAWGPRKGSRDWPHIVGRIRELIPKVRFKFLGTGVPAEVILSDLGRNACDWIEVTPYYESADLPQLLSGSTVGAFPSYIEGFVFAVLEMLAAGLPVVAYDVPGPRAMLRALDSSWMVPRGDAEGFANAICETLSLPLRSYARLSMSALERAKNFSWPAIARETLDTYWDAIQALRPAIPLYNS